MAVYFNGFDIITAHICATTLSNSARLTVCRNYPPETAPARCLLLALSSRIMVPKQAWDQARNRRHVWHIRSAPDGIPPAPGITSLSAAAMSGEVGGEGRSISEKAVATSGEFGIGRVAQQSCQRRFGQHRVRRSDRFNRPTGRGRSEKSALLAGSFLRANS